jgi:hypothetical protein
LHEGDKQILYSDDAWLEDRIMDAAQRLISGETKQLFQSVLLSQGAFKPVDVVAQQYVQLLHDTNHWVTSALLDGQVCFADSLGQHPTPSVQKQLKEI